MFRFMGTSEIISAVIGFIITILIVIFIVRLFKGKQKIAHLSLSKLLIDPEADDMVIIEGRKTGLIQWLLTTLKLGNTYQLKVKRDYIAYSSDSLAGNNLSLVPVHKVSSTECGHKKPILMFILAVICAVVGIVTLFSGEAAAFLILLIIAAVFFALYFFGKNFVIIIETQGGTPIGFSFKRSVIENVPVDIEKIREAIQIINRLIIESR